MDIIVIGFNNSHGSHDLKEDCYSLSYVLSWRPCSRLTRGSGPGFFFSFPMAFLTLNRGMLPRPPPLCRFWSGASQARRPKPKQGYTIKWYEVALRKNARERRPHNICWCKEDLRLDTCTQLRWHCCTRRRSLHLTTISLAKYDDRIDSTPPCYEALTVLGH